MAKMTTTAMQVLLLMLLSATTGCFWGLPTQGPSLGILAIPIPVSPYFQKNKEDQYWKHERYERVPILGPITSGGPPVALDPPSDDEIMRASRTRTRRKAASHSCGSAIEITCGL